MTLKHLGNLILCLEVEEEKLRWQTGDLESLNRGKETGACFVEGPEKRDQLIMIAEEAIKDTNQFIFHLKYRIKSMSESL